MRLTCEAARDADWNVSVHRKQGIASGLLVCLSMYTRKIRIVLVSLQAEQCFQRGALDGLNWLIRWSDLIMDLLYSLRRSQECAGQQSDGSAFFLTQFTSQVVPFVSFCRSQVRLFCLFPFIGHKSGSSDCFFV